MKIGISIDEKLLERVDSYADNNYMSRSGVITAALNQFMLNYECIVAIKNTSLAMRKIADTGAVDHDTMQQLEDFDRFIQMYLKGTN